MTGKLIGGFLSVQELRTAVADHANIPTEQVPFSDVMGVPITFMDKYNPEQFEIVGATESEGKGFSHGLWHKHSGVAQPMVKNNRIYKRLFIRSKKSIA